jgi:hypothetical protein
MIYKFLFYDFYLKGQRDTVSHPPLRFDAPAPIPRSLSPQKERDASAKAASEKQTDATPPPSNKADVPAVSDAVSSASLPLNVDAGLTIRAGCKVSFSPP